MKLSRRPLSVLSACLIWTIGAAVCGVSLGVAAPEAVAAEKKPFKSSDVFDQSMSYARSPQQWGKIQELLDKPAPRLEVGKFVQMSPTLPAKAFNEYRNHIIVLDFWATWCGPCIAGMPKNSEMAKKYADKGVAFLGVCNSSGGEKMVETGQKAGLQFPTVLDAQDKARDAFGVQWWPYYVVIDRDGVVRAAGASPAHLPDILDKILEYQPYDGKATDSSSTPASNTEASAPLIKPEWLEGNEARRRTVGVLENQPAPAFPAEQWLNTEKPLTVEGLKGNYVLVCTWATWCGNCKAAVPTLNEIHNRYAKDGLVVVGICAQRGHDKMADSVKENGILFPVVADANGRAIRDYRVDGYPDYYLIDREGTIIAADIKNGSLEEAVRAVMESSKKVAKTN
jgi:cytochrome c biogenesis protein CcmG/thiol:disulfide interchange protein DsbE